MPSQLMHVLILCAFFLGYFSINAYLGWRFSSLWCKPRWGRVCLSVLLFFLTIGYPAARIFAHEDGWPVVERVAEVWMGLSIFLTCWFLVAEALWFILRTLGRRSDRWRQVVFSSAFGFGILTALWGYYNAQQLHLTQYRVAVQKPDSANAGLRIVVLADLHLGKGKPPAWLEKVVDMTNKQNPDLVVLAGDIVDFSAADFERYPYAEIFRKIKSPLGVYAVRGNHDFFEHDRERLAASFAKAGIHLIDDDKVEIDGRFYLAGRKDRSVPREALADVVQGIDPSKPLFLLDHRPEFIEESQAAGVDVQFSGHTHGGQFFPATLITKLIYPINHGVLTEGPYTLVVSSGAGLWGPPFRVGSQSEVVVVDIDFQPSSGGDAIK